MSSMVGYLSEVLGEECLCLSKAKLGLSKDNFTVKVTVASS